MTKTKRQLRAEAMERLENTRMDSGNAVKKLAAAIWSEWNPQRVNYSLGCLKSRIIDLLTDDDSTIAEIESTIELLSDGADSREKLEAEASELVADYAVSGNVCDALYHGITALLDRQAAITANEANSIYGLGCEACRAAQKRRIAEITTERDLYREKLSRALDLAHEIERLMP